MPFPIHTLPPWLKNMVSSLAESTQTDDAMSAMFALGLLSSTVARRVVVVDDAGRSDPLNLWVIVIAASGEGKSSTFNPLIEPIESALTLSAADSASPELFARHPSHEPRIPTRYERINESFQTHSSDEPGSPRLIWVTPEALRNAMWLGLDAVNAHPDFIARDATPEALVEQIATQSMGVLQASPEGGFASWIAASGPRAVNQMSNLNLA
jgi:replicative DNA helicase